MDRDLIKTLDSSSSVQRKNAGQKSYVLQSPDGLPCTVTDIPGVMKLYSASVLPAWLDAVIRSWYLCPGAKSLRVNNFCCWWCSWLVAPGLNVGGKVMGVQLWSESDRYITSKCDILQPPWWNESKLMVTDVRLSDSNEFLSGATGAAKE